MRSSTPSTIENGFDSAMYGHTLITNGRLAYIMDPIHYDKIADKLMQFRGKLPISYTLSDIQAEFTVDQLKLYIDGLLANIDAFAELYAKGWIK